MGARVRKDPASVYANVGVYDGVVAIELVMDRDDGEGAVIQFGINGPDLILDFADVDSLELLAAVAAEGARQMRERITANKCVAVTTSEADRLVGAGVAG